MMLVFVATAIHQGPDWGEVAQGFVPSFVFEARAHWEAVLEVWPDRIVVNADHA